MQTGGLKSFEHYANVWVEITGLEHGHGGLGWEFGTCLWSPAKNRAGGDRYRLMQQVHAGDLVLHFATNRWPDRKRGRRVVGWSIAAGPCKTVDHEPPSAGEWAGSGRYYRVDLRNYTPFAAPLDVDHFIVTHEETLRREVKLPGFPFSMFGAGLRTNAGLYLRRCTSQLYELLMHEMGIAAGHDRRSASGSKDTFGSKYRRAGETQKVNARDPFEVDPEKVERGNRGHATTQDGLAAFLESLGIEPLSPDEGEPEYDLGWKLGDVRYVAEVKSITDANEEKQLRLGLGQLLRYRQALQAGGKRVVAVLAAERRPRDRSWEVLCQGLDVCLVWSGGFEELRSVLSSSPQPDTMPIARSGDA